MGSSQQEIGEILPTQKTWKTGWHGEMNSSRSQDLAQLWYEQCKQGACRAVLCHGGLAFSIILVQPEGTESIGTGRSAARVFMLGTDSAFCSGEKDSDSRPEEL